MSFSVSGIASGMDTDSIISKMLALEQRPIQLLQKRVQQFNQRLSAVRDLNSKVAALRSSAEMASDGFSEMTVSTSDSEVLTATATTDAVAGRHTVEVLQTAQAQKRVAQGVNDSTGTAISALGGTFSFKVGDGETTELTLDAGATLADLAGAINSADAGLDAAIINDGSASGAYRLVLTASNTGSEGEVTIVTNDTILDFDNKALDDAEALSNNSGSYTGTATSSGTYTGDGNQSYLLEIMADGAAGVATYRYSTDGGLTWDDNGGAGYGTTTAASLVGGNAEGVEIAFSDDGSSLTAGDRFQIDAFDPNLQDSRDAVLRIDGLSITSSSNSVSGVIEGLTLEIKDLTEGTPVEVTVAQDTNAVYERVNGLVLSYNSLATYINQQSAYDPETGASGALQGDATLRSVASRFRSIFGSPVPGLASGVNSLAMVGITASDTGTFSLDRTVFDEMLAEDPQRVEHIFLGGAEASTSQIRYVSKTNSVPSGTYSLRVDGVGDARTVTLGSVQLEINDNTVSGIDGTDFEGLVLELPNLDTLDEGVVGNVTLISGLAEQISELGDQMVDSTSGLIKGKEDSINRSIEDLNDQITAQQDRISATETRLRKQFTALEVTLGSLQSQSAFIMAQLGSS